MVGEAVKWVVKMVGATEAWAAAARVEEATVRVAAGTDLAGAVGEHS